MPRFPLFALVIAGVLSASCSGNGLTSEERAWGERATLAVARTNDVMALEFLPALLGDEYSGQSIVEVEGSPSPAWDDARDACSRLAAVVDEVAIVAEEAPDRYEAAGAD
jgi:hypothetical protein